MAGTLHTACTIHVNSSLLTRIIKGVHRWAPSSDTKYVPAGEPVVPHDRSSVRSKSRLRSCGMFRAASRMLLVTGVVLGAPLSAQQPPPVPPTVPVTPLNTPPTDSAAQDSTRRRIDPLVRVLPLIQDTLRLRRPASFGPFSTFNPLRNDADALARSIAESFRSRVEERRELSWQQSLAQSLTVPIRAADTVQVAAADTTPKPGALVPVRPDSAALLPGAGGLEKVDGVADYGIQLNSRLESKFQRTRNERCTATQITIVGNNCNGAFQPSFDFQFGVLSGGVVADRVHVNVDYDSQREFDASNTRASPTRCCSDSKSAT